MDGVSGELRTTKKDLPPEKQRQIAKKVKEAEKKKQTATIDPDMPSSREELAALVRKLVEETLKHQ